MSLEHSGEVQTCLLSIRLWTRAAMRRPSLQHILWTSRSMTRTSTSSATRWKLRPWCFSRCTPSAETGQGADMRRTLARSSGCLWRTLNLDLWHLGKALSVTLPSTHPICTWWLRHPGLPCSADLSSSSLICGPETCLRSRPSSHHCSSRLPHHYSQLSASMLAAHTCFVHLHRWSLGLWMMHWKPTGRSWRITPRRVSRAMAAPQWIALLRGLGSLSVEDSAPKSTHPQLCACWSSRAAARFISPVRRLRQLLLGLLGATRRSSFLGQQMVPSLFGIRLRPCPNGSGIHCRPVRKHTYRETTVQEWSSSPRMSSCMLSRGIGRPTWGDQSSGRVGVRAPLGGTAATDCQSPRMHGGQGT
mmetsp:Transcript_47739/g.113438  ORF Transcript_47739/g.113438 Transcript_47739/m.113438 type:complete len:360 (+) Transcript_47739:1752-2831(+)